MNDIQREIIDYIRQNRVSTTEVADALGKKGVLVGPTPVTSGKFVAGPVFLVHTWEESNWPVHEQIEDLPPEHVVVVATRDCAGRAIFGDLVSKYMILYRRSLGVVVDGTLRDAHRLIKEQWPIWCTGYNPVGCFNRLPKHEPDREWLDAIKTRFTNALAVCDDSGVVIIEEPVQTKEFVAALHAIEEQEDIWYECIDRKKWSTFKTICRKEYLEDDS